MTSKTIVGAPLELAGTHDVPLVELSAFDVSTDGGVERLHAVGDAGGRYAVAAVTSDGPGEWQVSDLHELLQAAGGGESQAPADLDGLEQLEALCVDGAGRLVLAQEEPSRMLVIDPAAGGGPRLVARLQLDPSGDEFLASVWDRDENSRAEAMVLLEGGRVLIVKEKRPICFGVFGPGAGPGETPASSAFNLTRLPSDAAWEPQPSVTAGGDTGAESLIAEASWPAGMRIERLGDISDAALGPDGALYLLSDQTASIARIAELPAPGEDVRPSHTWQIAGGPAKCEGLAFTADGTCFVGVDTTKPKGNLLRVEWSALRL